jgi:flagellar motor switch protein FliG
MAAGTEENINLSSRQQAAAALLAMDPDISKSVLAHMDPEEAALLSLEMVRMPRLAPHLKMQLLERYGMQLAEETLSLEGGRKVAMEFFGGMQEVPSAKAAMLSLKTEHIDRPFGALRALPTRILKGVLSGEHPQVVANVLAYLSPDAGREVLFDLPANERAEVALRMATLQDRPPLRQTILEIESRLADTAESILGTELPPAGGVEQISELLKAMAPQIKNGVLQGIEKLSPEIAKAVRKRLFTFEDLMVLDDRGMQSVLKHVETRDLALALKGGSQAMLEKVLANMSERGGEMLQEEIEGLGSTRKKMIEDAQEKILAVLSKLESDGVVVLERE